MSIYAHGLGLFPIAMGFTQMLELLTYSEGVSVAEVGNVGDIKSYESLRVYE